ncbi:hypothetical protein C8R43DRAFT_198741 [Mycena crocata]|nr:hypothetical protein C8R43DRAFT_198741 [Mycena crocata]
MAPDVSAVSNEASILTSLSNLLPSAALHALLGCIFILALLVYAIRTTSLPKATEDLQSAIASTEWIYYSSVEAGLFDQSQDEIRRDLAELQKKASELREESLRASLTVGGGVRAFCWGLSFKVMQCTKDIKILKTNIEIYREEGLRNIDRHGSAYFLLMTQTYAHIAKLQCNCKR